MVPGCYGLTAVLQTGGREVKPRRELNVTVCQLRCGALLDSEWERLLAHAQQEKSDLLLLPEMPFCAWPFGNQWFDPDVWVEVVAAHDLWQERLADVGAAVAYSRPVTENGRRLNRAALWLPEEEELILGRAKAFLPDEAGFWEASWYEPGTASFEPSKVTVGSEELCLGYMICTELWFMEHARDFGQAGAHLLLTPRSTEKRTVDKWLAGGRAAAIISGAYSLSSNHYQDEGGPGRPGGLGWVVGPDGEVLALTTPDRPFATVTIDLTRAERAKHTYPRYVAA
jgi:N-carbamoylputrescine amidase